MKMNIICHFITVGFFPSYKWRQRDKLSSEEDFRPWQEGWLFGGANLSWWTRLASGTQTRWSVGQMMLQSLQKADGSKPAAFMGNTNVPISPSTHLWPGFKLQCAAEPQASSKNALRDRPGMRSQTEGPSPEIWVHTLPSTVNGMFPD